MRDHTDITMLLDRSGSMGIIKDDTIGGINEFIDQQKKAGSNANLTLVQFDEYNGVQVATTFSALPIGDVLHLSPSSYQPRGNTPLLDALGKTIHATGDRLAAVPEADRPDKVVFVIVTDGRENASKEYTKAVVKALTLQQEKEYNWQFVYLGANQDAFAEAGSYGIGAAMAANFSPRNIRGGIRVASTNVASYRATSDPAELKYKQVQRDAMLNEDDADRLKKQGKFEPSPQPKDGK